MPQFNEKNNDTKDYSEQLEFLNSEHYYASKKLLTSRQIFRYAVPARTVTKKALVEGSSHAKSQLDSFSRFNRTPTCDGETDRHRPMASTADA